MEKKMKVLFLSTGNSTRGQMAEGFARQFAGDRLVAANAGIESPDSSPLVTEVMKEVGVDISGQKPKDTAQSLKEHFGYVVTLYDSARERSPVFPFTTNGVLRIPRRRTARRRKGKKSFVTCGTRSE